MKFILLFASFFSFFGSLHAQTYSYSPFPKQIGVWHFTEYNDYWNIIGGTNLSYQYDSTTGLMTDGWYSQYYESNKQIFHIYDGDTLLVYDFNLTIGDSVVITSTTFGTDTFYVTTDDSTGYYGRRKITFTSQPYYYLPTEWVEGIGNINGFWGLWSPFSWPSISGGWRFWCMYGDSVSIPCNSGLALEPEQSSLAVAIIYPNPVVDAVKVHNPNGRYKEFILRDVLGRIVLHSKLLQQTEMQVDVIGLTSGIYFIELVGEGARHSERIVKF
jgi:hypothetical protein